VTRYRHGFGVGCGVEGEVEVEVAKNRRLKALTKFLAAKGRDAKHLRLKQVMAY
jgi:hypothetical protein